jgi:hypothetical protein
MKRNKENGGSSGRLATLAFRSAIGNYQLNDTKNFKYTSKSDTGKKGSPFFSDFIDLSKTGFAFNKKLVNFLCETTAFSVREETSQEENDEKFIILTPPRKRRARVRVKSVEGYFDSQNYNKNASIAFVDKGKVISEIRIHDLMLLILKSLNKMPEKLLSIFYTNEKIPPHLTERQEIK